MSVNSGGLDYEIKVYDVLNHLDSTNLKVIGDKPSGGFNSHEVDLQLEIDGKKIDVEVKASMNAQMGGTSVRYDYATKKFEIIGELDELHESLVLDALNSRISAIDSYIDFVRQQDPIELHSNVTGIPLTVTKSVREKAKLAGLMKEINVKAQVDTEFVCKHYAKKGVNYIQIGGAGLFYMAANPLNLPIPKLTGDTIIEIRLGFAGGDRTFEGQPIRTAGLRVQGRLKFNAQSTYSLDDAESVKKMLSTSLTEDVAPAVLKHLTHIEEAMFTDGSVGIAHTKSVFSEFLTKLDGTSVRTKADGSPSLVAGWLNNKFFVATKGFFAKDRKINYTEADIKSNHESTDLQNKLTVALKELPSVIPDNGLIYQGDFMFTKSDLKQIRHDDGDYVAFRPNTITYAAKMGSDLYNKISAAEMGIVFHTSYKADLENLQGNYSPDLSILKQTPRVWLYDNNINSVDIAFSEQEQDFIKKTLLSSNKVQAFADDVVQYGKYFTVYFNSLIRIGEDIIGDPQKQYSELIEFIKQSNQKEIDKVKTDKSKSDKQAKMESDLAFFETNKINITLLLKLHSDFVRIKSIIVAELNKLSHLDTFLETENGYKVTSPEGYIAVNDNGTVKLIDRLEFSQANFNMAKNWS
jgi:hypothetical protein